MGQRHQEFLDAGARVFALSADDVPQNNAVAAKLALPFPILADPGRDDAITPLGFADENDPRQISSPSTLIVDPDGQKVFSVVGQDYADRPDEDALLEQVRKLGLQATSQDPPDIGDAEAGPKAMPYEGLYYYFSGAKFTALALRRRHRELGKEFTDDAKRYFQMVERYQEALTWVRDRRA